MTEHYEGCRGVSASEDPVDERGDTSEKWYIDWQNQEHVRLFDGRHVLSDRQLVRNYEAFNDVRMLNERLGESENRTLLEMGCATGEFYRYLHVTHPAIAYCGVDISRSAIARARQKYPQARFFITDPGTGPGDSLRAAGLLEKPSVVYSKDVVHHQTDPYRFVTQLLQMTGDTLIFRTRTRDAGKTIVDPELSCQYHYGGWMPYIVLNLQELIDHIMGEVPSCEIVAYRNRMILGGKENRFLPKECYLPETGTAETAIGVLLNTARPGHSRVEDRLDQNECSSLRGLVRRILKSAF